MTATLVEPWPRGLLTLEEWDALPPYEGFRLEVVEGVATPMAAPRVRHQMVVTTFTYRVDQQLQPVALTALAGVEVVIARSPLTIRIPDMVVVLTELYEADPARLNGADVGVVTEILSDGTRKVDRILKFAEYAEAGIPRYWILDVDDPVTLTSYLLVDGTYELAGVHTGDARLDVDGHAVTVDLDALVRP